MSRLRSAAGALALLGLLLSGCVGMPTSGPVAEHKVSDEGDNRRATDIEARPPVDGATRTEVVTGFLNAMTAWPIQTSVAKQFLTKSAAGQWNPETQMIVYSDTLPPREQGGTVSVELTSADRLDRVGGWSGALGDDELTLELSVSVEKGEYRIIDPPDALVVPSAWFQQRYRQVSLYYFDPRAEILVPEPVFVPEGPQLATSLVSALISGPPPRVREVVRTFIPNGLDVGLSVPVNDSGIADITLAGDAPKITADQTALLLAQLAWTLRQDPDIQAFRVTLGSGPLPLPGGATQYPVDAAEQFDPTGAESSPLLFGISQGRLITGSPGDLSFVPGIFGDERAGLSAVGVRPDGEQAAAVDRAGRRVRVASVRAVPGGAGPTTVLSGGLYARPTWDVAGRLWVLERRATGAVVWLVEGGRAREVTVPTISGRSAQQLIVSRDGTRLIGVVRTAAGDEVVGARISISGRGQVVRAIAPFSVRPPEGTRIVDLTWTSTIRVGILTATAPDSLYEVDVVAADGAAIGDDLLSAILSGKVLGLTGSPRASVPSYAIYEDRYSDILRPDDYATGPMQLSQLDYVG